MPSKMIIRREKSAHDVETAAESHGDRVEDAVHRALAFFLEEGESLPPLESLQRVCVRALRHHRENLVLRDEAHLQELRGDADLRHRRDTATRTVLDTLVKIRDCFQGVFGIDGANAILGLGGAMTRDPVVLARKGRRVLQALGSESLQLPPPLLPGLSVDVAGWVEYLEPFVSELETSLNSVASGRRKAEATLLAKNEAIADYDRTFHKVAQFMEGLYRLGDLDQLANQIRPSKRRVGQTRKNAGSAASAPQKTAPTAEIAPQPLRLVAPAS